ncbi:hypothetical protein SAMD00023353_6600370 [Rosellinia necatrix]|uniref:Rhodopsin domain-containing protein n=1 Tax=Rosellinia necatrix TaxID=77044 RepID=A0A1S8AAH6_ROSNE|nr:hypothetical protein SAMD00023353_6600370 [Rosellinia necatrix]
MGQSPSGNAEMVLLMSWILVGITILFAMLRFYIRIKITCSYGLDDHCYNIASALLLIYVIFAHVSVIHGVGRDISEIKSLGDAALASLYEMIGQTFLIVGNITSKASIGFFLIRMVKGQGRARWFKIIIWTPVVAFATLVTTAIIVIWLSCRPVPYLWDKRLHGVCEVNPVPISILAGASSVIIDLWYAVLPCYILVMAIKYATKAEDPHYLEHGLRTCICGIWDQESNGAKADREQRLPYIWLVGWHVAELAVTLIAVGIPICFFPLYHDTAKRLKNLYLYGSDRQNGGQDSNGETGILGTSTIGGTPYTAPRLVPSAHTRENTEMELGENIINIYGRNSSHLGLRGSESKESVDAKFKVSENPHQRHEKSGAKYEVIDGAILVQTEVKIRREG